MKHLLLNPHLLKNGHLPVHQLKKGVFGSAVHQRKPVAVHHGSSKPSSSKTLVKPLKFRF